MVIVALVTAALLAGGGVSLLQHQSQGSRNVAEKAAAQQRITTGHIAETCLSLELLARQVCVGEALAAQHEAERAEKDLNAQESMAYIALWMFILAGIQSLVAVAGIFFVARTLDLNAAATTEATRAADASLKAADAAERAYLSDHRPWLKLQLTMVGPIDFPKERIEIQVRVDNIGKSPALNVTARVHGFIVRIVQIDKTHVAPMIEDYVRSVPYNEMMSAVVFPQEPLETRAAGRITELSSPNLRATSEVDFAVVCTVTYRSAMSDQVFHTSLAYMVKNRGDFLHTDQSYTGEEQDLYGSRLLGWTPEPRITSVS